jgi:hypothetical protein
MSSSLAFSGAPRRAAVRGPSGRTAERRRHAWDTVRPPCRPMRPPWSA